MSGGGAGAGQMYSSSSVMSYSSTGSGPPKVYQASSSVRQGPGGVSRYILVAIRNITDIVFYQLYKSHDGETYGCGKRFCYL